MKVLGLLGLQMIQIFIFLLEKINTGKTVFLTWEQLFGIASMAQLGTLKLVILLSIRLRKNISKILKNERTVSTILMRK